jgi:hypothetical protein
MDVGRTLEAFSRSGDTNDGHFVTVRPATNPSARQRRTREEPALSDWAVPE